MAEIAEALRGNKFRWPEDRIEQAQRQIARFTQRVSPTETIEVVRDDPADNRILECAAAAKSDYVVSGDDHLLRLQQHGGARIVKVAEFLDIIRGQTPAPGPQH